ncbi:MAG: hypothetical protein HZB46_07670 [Solirubrobacterales bacterium]|nr:hypothetical protein [Solirubrobacterales bacterium]
MVQVQRHGVVAVLAALAALLVVASPAAATTQVTIPLPKAGDVSYGVVQVKIAKAAKAPARGRDTAVRSKVGGLAVDVRSPQWKKLKKTTKVYLVVSNVNGGGSKVRNVALFITRKKPGTGPKTGPVVFTISNAKAVKSFWVRKVDKKGVATVFQVRNILSTAVGNWTRYLATLASARAFRAAAQPVDVHGRFKARAAATAGKLATGGTKMTPVAKDVFGLIFGTINDAPSYQAAKQSPSVGEFIRQELGNAKLAAQWEGVAAKLPLAIPDTYAAAAKEEAKFTKVPAARVARSKVVIADYSNSTQQAAIQTPRPVGLTTPGLPVVVHLQGTGSGSVTDSLGAIHCPPTCSSFYSSGRSPILTAVPSANSNFVSWAGCNWAQVGLDCQLRARGTGVAATQNPTVTFDLKPGAPPAPAPPAGGGAAAPPTSLDPTFGTGGNGLTLTRYSQGGTQRSAYGDAITQDDDGNLVVVGGRETPGGTQAWVISRYTPGGWLDPAFRPSGSPAGTVVYNESGTTNGATAVHIEPLDQIDVTGQSETPSGSAAVRVYQLDPAGNPTGFGGSGIGSIPIPGSTSTTPEAIAQVSSTDDLIVAGTAIVGSRSRVFVARFNDNGSPDTTFNGGSAVLLLPDSACDDIPTPDCYATDMALGSDGAVYVSGFTFGHLAGGRVFKLKATSGDADYAVDTSYGDASTPGAAQIEPAKVVIPHALLLGGSGEVIVGGQASTTGAGQCGIAKLTPAGALDGSFGTDGASMATLENGCILNALATQPDGALLFVGETEQSPYRSVLGRFTAGGWPDSAFVSGGVAAVDAGSEPSFFNDVLVQGAKPVAVGGAGGPPHEVQLARYMGG